MRILFLFWVTAVGSQAFAGQWAQQCQKAAQTAVNNCAQVVNALKKNEAAMVASGAAASGTQINKNSGIEGSTTSAQASNLAAAQASCKQQRETCEKQCDSQKSAAAGAGQQGIPDVQQIPNIKKSQCTDPISQAEAQMGSGQQDSQQANKGSGDTGMASALGPLAQALAGMAGQQGGGDTPAPDPTSALPTSTTDTGSSITAPSAGQATFSNPAAGNAGMNAQSATGLQPSSTTDNAVRNGETTASTGAAASMGGGSSGSTGGASFGIQPSSVGGNSGKSENSSREGLASGIGSLATEGGGGGGGGGYGGNNGNDSGMEEVHLQMPNFGHGKEKPLLPAAPVAGSKYSDQSQPHGPSIFFIQDSAISSFCAKKGVKKSCTK